MQNEILETLSWMKGYVDCARHQNSQLDVYIIDTTINGLMTIIRAHEEALRFYGMRALEEIGVVRGYIIDSGLSRIQRAYLCDIIDNVSQKITQYYRSINETV